MDIEILQARLRQFAVERHWQPFHTPKNLSTALMVEAAELAEIFQWMSPEASQAAPGCPETRQRIADEVADVLLYLLQLADHCAIDIPAAVEVKMRKNAIKHPVPGRLARPEADPQQA
ncbi:nucleotide pyrophosphohydrolase [Rhodoferax sp.]|uniref:nucleotide pyrophosphohydrolase n=1 Tax=Rhodoferax sp. TaxID=50421 RepID=UPI002613C823|nr:nucleotide pyrophosphohydrolase [Rhodoferax sp.]MDD2923546.1 nucleotide pyrophosphohydrolase [Rhodoferax sp.]